MKVKGFCFISDSRYARMASWCKNSFEAHNPYEMVVLNLEEGCEEFEFHKWHIETKDFPIRAENPFGILKFMAALELMEQENLDKLIMLGADVITVGSFKGVEEAPFELLHSTDIGSAPNMPLNPDVIVVGKTFLQKAVALYKRLLTTPNKHLIDYQEMYILNELVNVEDVTNLSLSTYFNCSDYCFNKNVRSGVTFWADTPNSVVRYGSDVARTLHIQTGLYQLYDQQAFDAKLLGCLRSSAAFSDPALRMLVQDWIKDDSIWGSETV